MGQRWRRAFIRTVTAQVVVASAATNQILAIATDGPPPLFAQSSWVVPVAAAVYDPAAVFSECRQVAMNSAIESNRTRSSIPGSLVASVKGD